MSNSAIYCRGDILLGTACQKCDRCKERRKQVIQALQSRPVEGVVLSTESDSQAIIQAHAEVFGVVMQAVKKHPRFETAHHGYAVIKEELDELWTEVKQQCPIKFDLRREAIQVAAAAIRFAADLT